MLKVQITTAIELSSAQKSTMEKAIQSKVSDSDVAFEYHVDSHVLGGVRVIVGSREFDGTLRGKLNQISQQLQTQL